MTDLALLRNRSAALLRNPSGTRSAIDSSMLRPVPRKSLEEIALILMMRPARTDEGRRVHSAVLARVEHAMNAHRAFAVEMEEAFETFAIKE